MNCLECSMSSAIDVPNAAVGDCAYCGACVCLDHARVVTLQSSPIGVVPDVRTGARRITCTTCYSAGAWREGRDPGRGGPEGWRRQEIGNGFRPSTAAEETPLVHIYGVSPCTRVCSQSAIIRVGPVSSTPSVTAGQPVTGESRTTQVHAKTALTSPTRKSRNSHPFPS